MKSELLHYTDSTAAGVAKEHGGDEYRMLPKTRGRRMATQHSREGEGRGRSDGFTLLEVLVATALVGMVALAVAPLMLMAVQTSAVAQEVTEITSAGSRQLAVLRAVPFTDGQMAAGGSLDSSAPGYSLDPYNGDANLYVRWQIIDASASRKHIELVSGIRNSIWGPPRETLLETYRTDLQ